MRIAAIGAVAAATLGGALAGMPISSVSTPLPGGGCGAGCERLAAVLMPEPGPPSAAAQPAAAQAVPAPFSEAANVIAPGVSPSEPSVTAVPGVAGPGVVSPAVSGPAGLPTVPGVSLPGGIPDISSIPNPVGALQSLAAAAVIPGSVTAAYSLVEGVVGVGTGLVGTATEAAIAVVYLQNAGILPKNLSGVSLPSLGGVSLPSLAAAAATVQGAGLPALPALPAAALPALPALPPPAIPQHLCVGGFGPIGVCTP